MSAEIISHVPVRLEVPAVAGFIRERLANVLKMDEASINNEVSFVDYGLDSILGVDLIHSLNEQYRLGLKPRVSTIIRMSRIYPAMPMG